MKKHIHQFTMASGICLAASLGSAAYAQQGLYVKGDLGGAVTRGTDLKEFFGESVTPGTKVSFDPGVRFGMLVGYEFCDWFALEGETGATVNRIKSITDADVHDATYSNVPFLVNARFQFPSRCHLTPFFGGGVGGSAAVLDVDHIDFGSTTVSGTQSTAVFAYQAFGGLRYAFNDRMGLSLEYHYFATSDPEWKADVSFGTGTDKMRFGGTQSHTITVAFDYHF